MSTDTSTDCISSSPHKYSYILMHVHKSFLTILKLYTVWKILFNIILIDHTQQQKSIYCYLLFSVYSLFVWNNETLNIWSHLIGFLVFLVLTLYDNLIAIPHLRGETIDHIYVTIALLCFQVTILALIRFLIKFSCTFTI